MTAGLPNCLLTGVLRRTVSPGVVAVLDTVLEELFPAGCNADHRQRAIMIWLYITGKMKLTMTSGRLSICFINSGNLTGSSTRTTRVGPDPAAAGEVKVAKPLIQKSRLLTAAEATKNDHM